MAFGEPYNGWSSRVRHGRSARFYYRARTRGAIPYAAQCTCCRSSLPKTCVPYHAEEYGPTHEGFWASCVALCHRCHAMLHARFATPNLWRLYLSQVAAGDVDEKLFPMRERIAPSLSQFKARSDIGSRDLEGAIPSYFATLRLEPYSGPWKPATLLVRPLGAEVTSEVPDWTVYGEGLQFATTDELSGMLARGVDVDRFRAGGFDLPRKADGSLRYKPLY